MSSQKKKLAAVPRVGFVSLGCPKALVDSERIITQLRSEGYAISGSYADADVVVVNTCGFIDAAIEESMDAIGEALRENGRVIVTGCLGTRAETIQKKFPQVLGITGPHAYEEVNRLIHQHLPPNQDVFTRLIPPQGIKLTPPHYSYVKISEGCNHKCSFCIIPALRGALVSRPVNEILAEVEKLHAAGVKEVLIISQDTSAYGVDLKYAPYLWRGQSTASRFYDLAQALGEFGIWIRLHYVYPYPHVDDIIPLMAEGKILPYLDVPLQHASPRILKAMRRPADSVNMLQRIRQWRQICPEITLRSTFIVGFPGETAQDFEQLLEFLQIAQLDRVGCFSYSPVAGARANDLADAVPEDIKAERQARLMSLQTQISADKLQQKVGQTMTVLVDSVEPERIVARSYADAPEIDGLVLVQPGRKKVQPGELINVKINAADEHDLHATRC